MIAYKLFPHSPRQRSESVASISVPTKRKRSESNQLHCKDNPCTHVSYGFTGESSQTVGRKAKQVS